MNRDFMMTRVYKIIACLQSLGSIPRNLGAAALVLACCGVVHADDISWGNAPGKLYSVDNHRLHLNCKGDGHPVVILEAGLGGFSLEWFYVQEDLAKLTQVCSYDRAGYGWSDWSPGPRTTMRIVDELHALLKTAEIKPPYLLVGHSFGGFNMLYFSKSHPELIAGLVLVDSSHPDQFSRLSDMPGLNEENRSRQVISFFDTRRVLYLYPEKIRDLALQFLTSRKAFDTQRREHNSFKDSAMQVRELGKMPALPMIVVSRGKSEWPDNPRGHTLENSWQALQRELLDMVPDGTQMIAEGSGHLIQLERPDVVVRAVSKMLDKIN